MIQAAADAADCYKVEPSTKLIRCRARLSVVAGETPAPLKS
jgi:hypothetical protein